MRQFISPVLHLSAPAEPGEICEDFPDYAVVTRGRAVAPRPQRKPPENPLQYVRDELEPLDTGFPIPQNAQTGFISRSGSLSNEKSLQNQVVGGMPRKAEASTSNNAKEGLKYWPWFSICLGLLH